MPYVDFKRSMYYATANRFSGRDKCRHGSYSGYRMRYLMAGRKDRVK